MRNQSIEANTGNKQQGKWLLGIGILALLFITTAANCFPQGAKPITAQMEKIIHEAEARQRENRSIFRPTREWHHYLPPCPCHIREIDPNDWSREDDPWYRRWSGYGLQHYHPGAAYSYRSARPYIAPKGTQVSRNHGQQCTYGADGNLLKRPHQGAGTPDFVSPSVSWLNHKSVDVDTWEELGYALYNKYWVPNDGCEAPFNVLVGQIWDIREGKAPYAEFARSLERRGMRDTVLDVRAGDTIIFEAKGKVMWGQGGSYCGPGGSKKWAESSIGFIVAPPLFAFLPNLSGNKVAVGAGALFGTIIAGAKYNDVFYIGLGGVYRAKANGRLWLGINDGYPQNNLGFFRCADQAAKKMSHA